MTTNFAILTEFIPHGNLYDFLHCKEKELPPKMILTISKNLFSALEYLHTRVTISKKKKNLTSFFIIQNFFQNPIIVHRAVKSLNVLLASLDPSEKIIAKLADFGEAKMLSSFLHGRGRVDNCNWLAPEVMTAGSEYNEKSDIYSAGIVLWELATREHPFSCHPSFNSGFTFQLEDAILQGYRPKLPLNFFSQTFLRLIESCWRVDFLSRPSATQAMETLDSILVKDSL